MSRLLEGVFDAKIDGKRYVLWPRAGQEGTHGWNSGCIFILPLLPESRMLLHIQYYCLEQVHTA